MLPVSEYYSIPNTKLLPSCYIHSWKFFYFYNKSSSVIYAFCVRVSPYWTIGIIRCKTSNLYLYAHLKDDSKALLFLESNYAWMYNKEEFSGLSEQLNIYHEPQHWLASRNNQTLSMHRTCICPSSLYCLNVF